MISLFRLSIGAFLCATVPATANFLAMTDSQKWRGVGYAQQKPTAPKQRAQCRLTSTPTATGNPQNSFTIIGRCSTPAGASRLTLMAKQHSNGRLSATLTTRVNNTVHELSGEEHPDRLVFYSPDHIQLDGLAYRMELLLIWRSNGSFHLSQTLFATESDTKHTILEMEFQAIP
ncbi:hypothetical protein GCM10007939_02200 [Amylibacter marinus]|uniref:DUF3617 family protein n=1 Tax=Amylibacter marinus TaxID=1475483 RepID=A0ABQ5VRR0_9RHOB|nr:hypothetical protein [Amylibacter marinus]GLQ33937.1 hypothetical protein GCM10007939_02200 [Amylibacter marinus]